MKKLLFACLILSIFACNNQNSNSKENGKAVAIASENESPTSSCGSLILFHKGAVIENTSYDAAGKETSKQTTTVNDVKEAGGMLVATSSALMPGSGENKTISMNYKCDGTNLYADMASMLQNFEGLNNLKGDVKPVQFPLNISVGQTLPDASYTMSMNRGEVKMDITSSFKNRTVSAKENITTKAGSWDCYKINTDIESDVQGLDAETQKIMDAVKDKMKMNMIMWYHPKIGVVRTEMYQNGKLNSRSDVTLVKD